MRKTRGTRRISSRRAWFRASRYAMMAMQCSDIRQRSPTATARRHALRSQFRHPYRNSLWGFLSAFEFSDVDVGQEFLQGRFRRSIGEAHRLLDDLVDLLVHPLVFGRSEEHTSELQ